MESLVYDKIEPFVRPLISPCQHGFLSKRSSIAQLLACYSEVVDGIEDKHPTDSVYLDLRKAFDSVPHDELLFKLWRLGITGRLWRWFRGYLSDRQHYVCYKGYSSDPLPVISGVPQGSILGPLLFLVYINDIPEAICHSSMFLFADDAKLLQRIKSDVDRTYLQNDLHSVSGWTLDWKIKLNAKKCSQLHFSLKAGESDSASRYEVDDSEIAFS